MIEPKEWKTLINTHPHDDNTCRICDEPACGSVTDGKLALKACRTHALGAMQGRWWITGREIASHSEWTELK